MKKYIDRCYENDYDYDYLPTPIFDDVTDDNEDDDCIVKYMRSKEKKKEELE